MAKVTLDTPVLQEGVTPLECSASRMKFVREGDLVRIWCYTILRDPMDTSGSAPMLVPVMVLTIAAKAFDAFLAEGMVKVAEKIADGIGLAV